MYFFKTYEIIHRDPAVKEVHPSQFKHSLFPYSSTIIDVLGEDQW